MNTSIFRFILATTIAGTIAITLLILPMPARTVSAAPVSYTIVNVTTTADEYGGGINCSLREAIKSQNDSVNFGGCVRGVVPGPGGTDTILIPSGTYTLTLTGAGEDLDVTGDLDILTSMIISSTGLPLPTVTGDPNWVDRIFHVLTGTMTMKGLAIRGGWVDSGGGGAVRIEPDGSLTLNDSAIANCFAIGVDGGGIYNTGTLTLTNVTLSGNHANGSGGGIYSVEPGILTLANVTISDSTAQNGGGIYNDGMMILTDVTLSGNSADSGGGIYDAEKMTLVNVTLSANSAISNGGGIDKVFDLATLTNVTFSGNSADYGGGVYNNTGTITLTNVTLSSNTAAHGGGIYRFGGTVALLNTIVANSPVGGNCSASLGGNANLSSDNTCGFGVNRNNVNVMLAPLGNYSGPTLTHIPRPGSLAVDNGDNLVCPSTDQRGKPRPVNSCDVGAVERQLVDFSYWLNLPLIRR